MLTKPLLILCGVLLGLLCLCGALYGLQRHSLDKARGEARVAKEQAQNASQELTKARLSFRVDMDAIKNVQKAKDSLSQEATRIREKVDAVAKQVEDGQLSSAVADNYYLDSMWETYCQGTHDPSCSTRPSPSAH